MTCDYSDLPTDQCHHCDSAPRPGPVEEITARSVLRVAHPVASQTVTRDQAREILNKAARALDRGQPATLTDYVDALTRPTTHYEPYSVLQQNPDGSHTIISERHRTVSLPLLEQLASAAAQSAAGEQGRRVFGSKPSARIDAIDVLQDIDREVRSWLRRLHLEIPDKHDTAVELRRAAANAGPAILRDLRSWWIRARTVTGWDSAAWRPNNTCPLCAVKGGLRVRQDATSATCVSCGEVWDTATIGLLGEHIRTENHEDEDQEQIPDVG